MKSRYSIHQGKGKFTDPEQLQQETKEISRVLTEVVSSGKLSITGMADLGIALMLPMLQFAALKNPDDFDGLLQRLSASLKEQAQVMSALHAVGNKNASKN